MRALITGSDGFLGANLATYLQSQGHEVTGAALSRKGQTSLDALGVDIRLEYGDVQDAAFIERIVNAYEPDVVYHLAAISIVRIAAANPTRAIRTNVLGTLNVVDACKRANVRCVVASSDKAYGDNGGQPYREDTPLRPTGAYELSKAMADMTARQYGAIVTRCANLYGPGDLNWSRLVPHSCRRAVRGEAPEVTANAWDYQREWLYVEDACRAYALLATEGECSQAYNVGSGEQSTAGAVACWIAALEGAPMPVEVSRPAGYYEIPAQQLDSGRIGALGWGPWCRLESGLRTTLNWYAEYLNIKRLVPA